MAEEIRHPNGVIPKAPSPRAISHLPTSGWTTMLGVSVHRSAVRPARMRSLAFST
jgi:hypothetical protein